MAQHTHPHPPHPPAAVSCTDGAQADSCCGPLMRPRPAAGSPHKSHAEGAHEPGHDHDHSHDHGHDHSHADEPGVARLASALALAVLAELGSFLAPEGSLPWSAAGLLLAALAIWLAGGAVYRQGLQSLRRGRLNINALMAVAVTGAVAIGEWPEAAMVMVLYAIAEAIEGRAVGRARQAIERLMAMAPEQADVQQGDGSWLATPVAEVPLQAVVRVRPGERVPMDAVVLAGQSSVDQAPVTGESLPVDKAPGDPVYAGTVNQGGLLECRVSAPASDSTLSRIIQAVETAQASKAPTQRLVDRFAAVYTPGVFVAALLVAVLGPWLADWTGLQAVYKALVLLVIACPCALVISTPVTVVSALAAAARRGILVKGGVHLENARKLKSIAFDKTGTLTEGKPRLVDWSPLADRDDPARLSVVAAALATASDHPVSQAIARGLVLPGALPPAVQGLQALAGQGVQAQLDGQTWLLGNQRLIESHGLLTPALRARLAESASAGHSLSLLATPDRVWALFRVADTLKASSPAAVAALRALGIVPVMLSGDHPAAAEQVAAQVGISEVQAGLLPEDKRLAIQALQQRLGPTAMAGDGINDAPALAQSDLGVAMGAAGTDIAMEAADVVVMNDDLGRVAELVQLSRATHRVLWQNILLALGIKAVFLLLALGGQATMWMAVFADMGASLLVVGNGLRLLRRA